MTKRIVTGTVVCNKEIAKDIWKMTIDASHVASSAKPGQFVNVYMKDRSMLLPRPISICDTEGTQLTLVYKIVGKGTAEMSGYEAGDSIRMSDSLGNGFHPDHELAENIILVGGGVGVPPLVKLAKALREENGKAKRAIMITAVIGFQEEPFLTDELTAVCDRVYLATDNGAYGFHGNVVELIKQEGIQGDYYYSCGPKPMLKSLAQYCAKLNIPVQVSLEERMGCGYGACVGCTCKTKGHEGSSPEIKLKKVCKDGPVFLGSEVIWDE